jgi:hypothetical protein
MRVLQYHNSLFNLEPSIAEKLSVWKYFETTIADKPQADLALSVRGWVVARDQRFVYASASRIGWIFTHVYNIHARVMQIEYAPSGADARPGAYGK